MQQKKLIPPPKPEVFPRGPHNKKIAIAPPMFEVPKKGFRNRPKTEVLCPDCVRESTLCPDCVRQSSLCPDCAKESTLCPDCAREEASKTYQPSSVKDNLRGKVDKKQNEKYSSKTYQNKSSKDYNEDNYKYHEINETTDKNKKSLFYVKKEGVIISTNE